MTIINFLTDYMPKYLGINKAYGEIAKSVYLSEKEGNPIFANEQFETIRKRAAMGIPCCEDIDSKKKENMLDFFEYCLCIHRQRYHSADCQNRIAELSQKPAVNEMVVLIDPGPEGFWN